VDRHTFSKTKLMPGDLIKNIEEAAERHGLENDEFDLENAVAEDGQKKSSWAVHSYLKTKLKTICTGTALGSRSVHEADGDCPHKPVRPS